LGPPVICMTGFGDSVTYELGRFLFGNIKRPGVQIPPPRRITRLFGFSKRDCARIVQFFCTRRAITGQMRPVFGRYEMSLGQEPRGPAERSRMKETNFPARRVSGDQAVI